MKVADSAYGINAHSSDRLGFGLFFAAAAHACLIFGLAFDAKKPEASIAELEITLVTHYSDATPEDADFWAQQNQEASGTEEEALVLTSKTTDAMPGENDAEGTELQQSNFAAESSGAQVVTTTTDTNESIRADLDAEEEEASYESQEVARRNAITARLDILQQDYAKRPRIGTLTSVAAKARDDAEYQIHLQDRIVANGNANYPTASLEQGVFGSLRLMMTILHDGTLESIEILESSGELVLDRAALDIARASAPFNSFPTGTRERYDKIVFIRTWQFLPGGRLRAGE